jgi:hypothetical protein
MTLRRRAALPLPWAELERRARARSPRPDARALEHGPASAQAAVRLFGQPREAVRVTLCESCAARARRTRRARSK